MKTNFIFIYIVTLVSVVLFFENQKELKVYDYLQKDTRQYSTMYEMHYEHYKDKANLIFGLLGKNEQVVEIYKELQDATTEQKDVLRQKLYLLLKDKYASICSNRLKQLHFHLKNNESFLRFHDVQMYGDYLGDVRETIKYVNEHKRPIDGFEEGRVYSGYRFVYPLTDESNKHLGSVEISYDMAAFTKEFMSHFDILSNLHIKKSVVEKKVWKENREKYNIPSTFDGYYMEKNTLDAVLKKAKKHHKDLIPSKESIEKINKALHAKKLDTIYLPEYTEVITVIPLLNGVTKEMVGFLTIRGDGSYLRDIYRSHYLKIALFIFFSGVIAFLLYKKFVTELDAKEKLIEQVKYEVEQNRIKDMELLRQSKLSSLGEMMTNIAHQWRQPLNAISMTAMSLQVKQELETIKPQDIKDATKNIIESSEYLSGVIEIFRNFISPNPSVTKVCLQDEIEKTLQVISAVLDDCHIEVSQKLLTDEKIITTMAQGELSQVLLNLFNNAKDVMIERKVVHKWIEITLEKKGEVAILAVEDNGGGIREDILEKIFEPYFTTKYKSGGTGLGLSMSHKIVVKDFKGRLSVENTANGAKFTIEIPITESKEHSDA